MLGGLKLLLSAVPAVHRRRQTGACRRCCATAARRRPGLDPLAEQVLGALHELLRGLHAADREPHRDARRRSDPAHLYEGLLTVLMRLVFLLYAEDRDLIPSRTDGRGAGALRARLRRARPLRPAARRRARYPDTMDERRGAWGRLLALFRLVHAGDSSGWIAARGGKLFDPDAFPFLEGQDAPRCAARSGAGVRRLHPAHPRGLMRCWTGERLSYRTLDVEQIGSVYETVMGFTVADAAGPGARDQRRQEQPHAGVRRSRRRWRPQAATSAIKYLKEEADRGQLPAERRPRR